MTQIVKKGYLYGILIGALYNSKKILSKLATFEDGGTKVGKD